MEVGLVVAVFALLEEIQNQRLRSRQGVEADIQRAGRS